MLRRKSLHCLVLGGFVGAVLTTAVVLASLAEDQKRAESAEAAAE